VQRHFFLFETYLNLLIKITYSSFALPSVKSILTESPINQRCRWAKKLRKVELYILRYSSYHLHKNIIGSLLFSLYLNQMIYVSPKYLKILPSGYIWLTANRGTMPVRLTLFHLTTFCLKLLKQHFVLQHLV
jgi:hypothetical protein